MGDKEVPYASNFIDLTLVRKHLELPSQLVAALAKIAGQQLVSVRPGRVESTDGQGTTNTIRVSIENVYSGLARAYVMAGETVPQEVLDKIEKWDRDHGLIK